MNAAYTVTFRANSGGYASLGIGGAALTEVTDWEVFSSGIQQGIAQSRWQCRTGYEVVYTWIARPGAAWTYLR